MLVVWTPPPGPREFQAALRTVQPETLVLLDGDPGLDEPNTLLSRLAGLAKFALRAREGRLDLEAAAAATAQRVASVQAGLEWLAAQGQVLISERGEDEWRLAAASSPPDPQAAAMARARLEALLEETTAYRDYFRHAPAEALAQR
jgi:hypothetical protein